MKYYKLIGWHEFRFQDFYILLRRRLAWPPMRIKRRTHPVARHITPLLS